jgi:hypothetical protein
MLFISFFELPKHIMNKGKKRWRAPTDENKDPNIPASTSPTKVKLLNDTLATYIFESSF